MYIFGDNIDARHSHVMLSKPVSQRNGRPVGPVAVHDAGRDHLEALTWKAPFFQKIRAHAGRGVVIVDVASKTHCRSARRKNASVVVILEFLYRRADRVFVHPAFDYQDISVHTVRYSQKRINTKQK